MEDEWSGQTLHQFAMYDRHDAMADVLQGEERKNINAPDKLGRTPVFTAVSNNSIKCLEILLQHGAAPNITTQEKLHKMTPLHQAVHDAKTDAIQLLLEFGGDLNKPDMDGMSPMELVKHVGHPDHIKMFQKEDERRKENAMRVVIDLCMACEEGDLERVRDILKVPPPTGWDLANRSVNNDDRTALVVAAKIGEYNIMAELLESVNELLPQPSVVHTAVENGHAAIVKLIIQHFPECCQATDANNQTPVHLACQTGSLEIVKLLMEFDYPETAIKVFFNPETHIKFEHAINLNSEDSDNKSAIFLACEHGHEEIVDYLLNFKVQGKVVSAVDDQGSTLSATSTLSASSGTVDSEFINYHPISVKEEQQPQALSPIGMESGTVHYKRDRVGNYTRSCMFVAVKNRHLRVVDKLLEFGASLELYAIEKDVKYSVLLKQALDNSDLLMLNKLLESGANDVNNFVFEETVRSNVRFVSHFLKYKVGEDKLNSINKATMKVVFKESSVSSERLEDLPSSDPKFLQIFPKEAVHIRWQNLKVLTTVDKSWLTTAAYFLNPSMSSLNERIPLFAIARVDISNNSLTIVPAPLLQLPSLVTLSASNNEITEFPSLRNFDIDCEWLEEINIHHNKLTTIPDYIFLLPKLRSLNASSNLIHQIPSSIWQADFLRTVNLSDNKIEELPKPVFLHPRTESETSTQADDEMNDTLGHFPDQSYSSMESHVIFHSVTRANHWARKLVVNDAEVKNAKNGKKGLKTLKLNQNQMKVFPDFLSCCCPNLETLELMKNKLKRLGNLAAYPKKLKTLDLSLNVLENMKDWQTEDDTKKRYCDGKSGSVTGSGLFSPRPQCCVHRSHTRLESLETLELSGNKLAHLVVLRNDMLTISMAKSTTQFQNQETIEQNIQRQVLLPSLNSLHIDNNQLTELPGDIKEMKALRVLSLKQNMKLTELPPALGLLDGLQRIEVEMCPIAGPIQDVIRVASNRAADITGFLRSVLEEAVEYNCMNLMIVGSYNIGKTSLMKHLMKKGKSVPTFKSYTVTLYLHDDLLHFTERQDPSASGVMTDGSPLSTVGIDISQLILEGKKGTVDFRTWDFAGQKEYYATHQYFLSPRSLYLVVWNLTDGEPGIEELKQWLVNIQAQAKGSAVIIIGTHLDEIKKKNFPKDWESSMNAKIREKYQRQDNDNIGLPYVIDIVNVAAGKSPKNIETLKNRIYEKVFQLKHPGRKTEKLLGHKVPKKYLKLQHCIANIAKTRVHQGKEPVLNGASYLLLVMEEMSKDVEDVSFRNKDDLNQATRFLHENGVICHFEDTLLKNQYFLEPQWLCDQLAKVVSVKEVQKYANKGVMKKKDLSQVYKNSDKIGQYILSLLNKFEVALAIDDDLLILPSLLPTHKDITDPCAMTKIPILRKSAPLPFSNQSTDGMPMYSHSPLSSGEMFIHCTKTDNKAAFSNTRLYLLTYFPSGFWPRLITRVLADESFFDPVINLYKIPQEIRDRCPEIQRETPSWRCWQTGLELVYFDNVIMQVKEVHSDTAYGQGMCNYNDESLSLECFFDSEWSELDVNDSVILEISFRADKITFNFGFNVPLTTSHTQNFQSIEQRDIYHDEKMKTGILAKVVEHIDNLLQDWFPDIGESRFNQTCLGRYLVTRVIPCPLCLQTEINCQFSAENAWDVINKNADHTQPLNISGIHVDVDEKADDSESETASRKRVMCTFLVEKCIKNVLEGMTEICKIHKAVSPMFMPGEDGAMRQIYLAPDAVFHDLDVSLLVEDDILEITEELGRGAFGTVFAGKLKRSDYSAFDVAMKVLYDPARVDRKRAQQTTQISLETVCSAYTNARQEISILETVEHAHIVPFLGLSRRPLALLLSRAPMGSLNSILENRQKDGLKLPVWVIKQVVIQVTDALDYLHNRNIIYRDLKSDNVLVWHFPPSYDLDPALPVLVKLADYGISKPVYPSGEAKGFAGTPPFIAPEILVHTGRDTYTEKVDMFSFGMFMFELLTCRTPLAEINNITVHVAHGGRPTLTTEEAIYPSHMLDVMTVCWDHDPQNRPSAAHVRMIASTPQFCHLSDAVTMETESTVLSATSVFVESSNFQIEGEKNDHSQVWMISLPEHDPNVHKVEILSYNTNNKCIGSKELKQDLKIVALCNVDGKVWCLDLLGEIHIFCPLTFEKLCDIQLQVNKLEQVFSMSYHPETGGHVVILLKEYREISTTLFCIADDKFKSPDQSHDQYEPMKIARRCLSAATVQSGSGCKLWVGTDFGEILVKDIDHLHGDVQDKKLCPNITGSEHQLCRFIATPVSTPSADCHRVWTYIYPGSKVFCWDSDSEKVTASFDCSIKIPKIEKYNLSKKTSLQANHFQVTALLVFGQYLYTSTTWGCVIVADAVLMNVLSVFRCHGKEEFYCKAILPIGPCFHASCETNPHSEQKNKSGRHSTERKLYDRNLTKSVVENNAQANVVDNSSSGVVSIGRGYVDVIKRVTNLEKQVLVQHDTLDGWSVVEQSSAPAVEHESDRSAKCNTYVLSWDPHHWNYF